MSIKTDEEHTKALEEISKLMDEASAIDTRLQSLASEIEEYERARWPRKQRSNPLTKRFLAMFAKPFS